MKIALTIAGSDPTGGAGFQMDLKVFHALGVYGLSVPACLTAQNTKGVDSVFLLPARFIKKELETLLQDIRPHALKTGMLLSKDAVKITAGIVREYRLKNLVVDPVHISSSGKKLIERNGFSLLREKLLPLAGVVTPNLREAEALAGIKIKNPEDMARAARLIREMGPKTVIITGGHLEGNPVDLFWDGKRFHLIKGKRIPGQYHGTGCACSAAITALLAKGETPLDAAKSAKRFMEKAIKKAEKPGKGMGVLGI
jgi:hydroxymethylpyrimidine/phosphomethylpyrimidine kinase